MISRLMPAVIPGIILVLITPVLAWGLDVGRSLEQLHHTAWTVENGAPPDVWALAQSFDGFLWLGTGAGLFRFDGVVFEQFHPVRGDRLPSSNINSLCASHTGDLWIGFATGAIGRLSHGRLQSFDLGLRNDPVYQIVEDDENVVWAALNRRQAGGLARYVNGQWQVLGADWGLPATGSPMSGVTSVLAAHDGSIWAVVGNSLFLLRHGSRRFEDTGQTLRENGRVVQAPNGRIWLSSGNREGLRVLPPDPAGAKPGQALWVQPQTALETEANRMIVDRDGAIWGTYQEGGIFRIRPDSLPAAAGPAARAAAEKYGMKDGLSSDLATPLLEDREGNIWIGSNLGLDRFRIANVVPAAGIPVTSRHGFFAARGAGGSVFVLTSDTLFRAYPDRPAENVASFKGVPAFLDTDLAGGIWIGSNAGVSHLEHGNLVKADLPAAAAGGATGWTQDRSGRICIAFTSGGVFCAQGGAWEKLAGGPDAKSRSPVQLLADDQGRTWIDDGSALAVEDNHQLRTVAAADLKEIGGIDLLASAQDGLLVGGEFGLARFDGARFTALPAEQYPLFTRITGIVQNARGDTWLAGIKGVVRLRTKDLWDTFSHPGQILPTTLFDLDDGLPGVAQQDSHTPTAIVASDGRVWFTTSHGIAWVDPDNLAHNPLPPPVSITALLAAGRAYGTAETLQLQPGISNLEIDYTALSLSIPKRVRFRYRLDGVDHDWVDPGTRRQAFYTKLAPGSYLFHVVAANNDGVWNNTGATLTFAIPPTFIQSWPFKLLIALSLTSVATLLYRLRIRRMAERMTDLLEVRVMERERIARDLHDTLLQGFQGLLLQFQAAAERIHPEHPTRRIMEKALDLADHVLAKGRDKVSDLRREPETADISTILSDAAKRMFDGTETGFSMIVEGQARSLHPVVSEEVSCIGQEALANAAAHAGARNVDLSIVYHPRELRMNIRDDGVGIDQQILSSGSRGQHFGMLGMHERARRVRAKFAITSGTHIGTEVALAIPASVAYLHTQRRLWPALRRKRT